MNFTSAEDFLFVSPESLEGVTIDNDILRNRVEEIAEKRASLRAMDIAYLAELARERDAVVRNVNPQAEFVDVRSLSASALNDTSFLLARAYGDNPDASAIFVSATPDDIVDLGESLTITSARDIDGVVEAEPYEQVDFKNKPIDLLPILDLMDRSLFASGFYLPRMSAHTYGRWTSIATGDAHGSTLNNGEFYRASWVSSWSGEEPQTSSNWTLKSGLAEMKFAIPLIQYLDTTSLWVTIRIQGSRTDVDGTTNIVHYFGSPADSRDIERGQTSVTYDASWVADQVEDLAERAGFTMQRDDATEDNPTIVESLIASVALEFGSGIDFTLNAHTRYDIID